MRNKLLFVVLIFLINYPAWSWDKSKFDISIDNEHKALKKVNGLGYAGQEIKKTVSEVTLVQGCYFTIGTNQGLSSTGLDDHCGVTFGHPYALTSYPLLSIDGSDNLLILSQSVSDIFFIGFPFILCCLSYGYNFDCFLI